MKSVHSKTYLIIVDGLVQGVGFRPFIFRLASDFGLAGVVENRNNGVFIHVNTSPAILGKFIHEIRNQAPIASSIQGISYEEVKWINFDSFSIVKSQSVSDQITGISPDICVCKDCLEDMQLQDHRIDYPFTNCTNCGPRFTIIRDLPYDRANTTMTMFPMCPVCQKEYRDVHNRRFHAQPVACNHCGPEFRLITTSEKFTDIHLVLNKIADMVEAGEVLAVKGLGGYHLMCDALNAGAVEKLRHVKVRESKPFAVMCSTLAAVKEIAYVSEKEADVLESWQRPVVLLASRNTVANGVSNGLDKVGVMLPYLPFHHLMFRHLRTNCVVLTSGNISDEPIIISNEEAMSQFLPITAGVVTNNRDIHNRCDDSVMAVVDNNAISVRRSRGYVPTPVKVWDDAEGIFASGAELVNCFAIGKGEQVILSQHIGDLKNAETFEFYKETYDRFCRLFRFQPALIISDLHTSYLSGLFARELSEKYSVPLMRVQHHHAHIVSCMAEHHLDEPVIGISMDGVGLGTDAHIWGGEFMLVSRDNFKRMKHLEYIPIAGGDKVAHEPWRSAAAYLHRYLGNDGLERFSQYLNEGEKGELSLYQNILSKNINTFQYSSAGRLFDAVAALSGVCLHAGFHAEAPMRLESVIDRNIKSCYPFEIRDEIISFGPAISEIVKDRQQGVPLSAISARFHNAFVEAIFQCSLQISADTGIKKIVVSGGTFQNVYLLNQLISKFSKTQLSFYFQQQVPSNDGGLALGQVAVAAKRRKLGIL